MSRISSLAANNNLIQQMLRTQINLFDLQSQVNSGKKSQDYAGIARNSERLINLENTTSLLYRYVENNEREQTRLNVGAAAVQAMRESISNFQKDLVNFKQGGTTTQAEVEAVQAAAFRALRDMEDMLNTEVDGRYIFAGGKSTTQPVTFGFGSVEEFQAVYDGARIKAPTTRDAHLEEFSVGDAASSRNKKFIDGTNFLQFRRDSDGSSTIRATAGLFSDLTVGSTIEVTDTTSNNGTYTVTGISADGTTLTVQTEMLTDETVLRNLTDENPAGAVSFLLEDGSTATSVAGDITFDRAVGTFTDAGGGLFAGVSAGDFITISGSGNNNGTVQVQSVDGTNSVVTVVTAPTTIENEDGSVSLDNIDTGALTFSRSGDTITAGTVGAFSGIAAGEAITISGTDENDGTYTVASNDGTTITIEAKKLTDEGLSGATFFNHFSDTDLEFTNATSTIEVRQSGTATAVADIFANLQAGDRFTVTGTASNDGTYTIDSIAADGSSVTVVETLTDETFQGDGALAGVSNGFSYASGTQMDFVDNGGGGTNTIQLQDSLSAAIPGVFGELKVGETFTVSGTAAHDGVYTITAISGDGSQVTVAEDFAGGSATDTDGAELEVFAASGTVSASSYFDGDQSSITHRVDKDREFEFDINAASPGFEKAIRAMKIILQGAYGTEGGLDGNMDRVQEAIYLLGSAMETTVAGTPPYGPEETGSLEQIQQDIGFNQYLIKNINEQHTQFIGFLEASTADVENADPLEAITKLLDDQRALQASYQAFARIRQLSLTNFL